MVGSGTILVAISVWFWSCYWLGRGTILDRRTLLRALMLAGPLGFLGLEAGWFVTEVGRQPWIIQQVMRTSEAVTPAKGVPGMFCAFTLLYALLTVTVIVQMWRISKSPREVA